MLPHSLKVALRCRSLDKAAFAFFPKKHFDVHQGRW